MTATPIPRTTQAALAGLQDLSVIATPPVRRQPVRTFVLPFDGALVRDALLRERRRGGRSFVVVPRVADLEPMAERLAALVPELDTAAAHGRMRAEEMDDVVVAFAQGRHDVLLATSIIETGLDIPGADTMVVWRPDRFGIAQLHQLRGRVGRGRARAVCYLLSDPESPLPPATERRLKTLGTLEGLGAGFAIAARDLDLRGAGDLLGEEQAGHVKLIGTGLYQHLLERALRRARGEAVPEEWSPELRLGVGVAIPRATCRNRRSASTSTPAWRGSPAWPRSTTSPRRSPTGSARHPTPAATCSPWPRSAAAASWPASPSSTPARRPPPPPSATPRRRAGDSPARPRPPAARCAGAGSGWSARGRARRRRSGWRRRGSCSTGSRLTPDGRTPRCSRRP
jgi:hypothetical protein